MVDVVFHVGAHKCATTSIQSGLARRRSIMGGEVCAELQDLVRLVGRGAGAGVSLESVVDGLCRQIELHADRSRIVFSDEYILGGMPGLRWSFYPNAGLAREAIEGVARRFKTSVFLQSRETVSYLRSSYRFRVRLGLKLSYLSFLETYELDSISWSKLGATLFDGAAYDWRALPIERLREPVGSASVLEALDFVVPGWEFASAPLRAANASEGPLMRAILLVLNRAGEKIDYRLRREIGAVAHAAEPMIGTTDEKAASDVISQALASVSISLEPRMVNMIRAQFDEERQSDGALNRLLTARFAPDYETFVARYAPPVLAPAAF